MIPAVVIAESTTGTKRDTATNRAIKAAAEGAELPVGVIPPAFLE